MNGFLMFFIGITLSGNLQTSWPVIPTTWQRADALPGNSFSFSLNFERLYTRHFLGTRRKPTSQRATEAKDSNPLALNLHGLPVKVVKKKLAVGRTLAKSKHLETRSSNDHEYQKS
jgi:hypothetical protein